MATKTIHSLVYKLYVDSSKFDKGMVATRGELNQAKRAMKDLLKPAEKIEIEFAKLGKLLKKGAIDQDLFNRKAAELRKEYKQTSAAGIARAEAERRMQTHMERGRALTDQMRSAEERHAIKVDELNRLKKLGAIKQATYNRSLEKSKNTLPAVVAMNKSLAESEARHNSELERGRALTNQLRTAEERHADSIADINRLRKSGAINEETYRRALKKSVDETKHAARGIQSVKSALHSTIAAYVSFQTVAGTGRVISAKVDEMDKLAKASKNIGTSTEFLSGLEFVSGRESGFTDGQAARGIEKMTRRVAEAAKGTGEAKKELERLGLSAQELTRMGPEKAFFEIARSMDHIKNAGERSAIAMKIFDDEQAGIHSTMALTTAEYEKHIKLAEQLGAILTEGQAKKAQQAKDDLADFQAQKEGLQKELALASAPAIGGYADVLEATRNNGTFGKIASGDMMGAFFGQAAEMRKSFQGRELVGLATPESRKAYWAKIADDDIKKKAREQKLSELAAKHQGKTLARGITTGVHEIMRRAANLSKTIETKLSDTHIRINPKMGVELSQTRTGPMDSIAAGSGEAFKLMNQTTATASVEVELARQSKDKLVETVSVLEQIRDLNEMNRWERKEHEDN